MVAVPNIFLIIIAIIVPILVVACTFFFLVYFSSPDDKNQAWIPKILVIVGLTIAAISILMLPFDVANVETNGHLEVPIEIVWQILYLVIAVFVVAIIPFCIFYYEAQDPDIEGFAGIFNQVKWGIIFSSVIIFVAAVIVGATYYWLGIAEIPYKAYSSPMLTNDTTPINVELGTYTVWDQQLKIRLSPVIYMIAALSFAGWIFFVPFAGCGMTSLPLGLILSFVHRPKRMKFADYAQYKVQFKERAEQLMQIGNQIKERQQSGKGGRKTRQLYNAFKQAVFNLEDDYHKVQTAYEDGGGSPIKHFFVLVFGILSIFLSIAWIVQIILYLCFPWPLFGFLNYAFIYLNKFFSLFGITAYGAFTFYLVFAVISGNVKFGERLLFFSIHPMKYKDTLMNSFLFNVGLILLCTVSITQFASYAFADFAAGTAISAMFNTYVRHMVFLRYFWIFFPHALLLFAIIAFPLCIIFHKRPNRDLALSQELIKLGGDD